MAKIILSQKKTQALTLMLFLIGLAILTFTKAWWPSIMLVVGLPLALRQYLSGKIYDMIVSLVVFIGVFITVQFQIKWDILIPVLFIIGGIYLFFREFFSKEECSCKHDDEQNDKE